MNAMIKDKLEFDGETQHLKRTPKDEPSETYTISMAARKNKYGKPELNYFSMKAKQKK